MALTSSAVILFLPNHSSSRFTSASRFSILWGQRLRYTVIERQCGADLPVSDCLPAPGSSVLPQTR